jgi:DNA repair exonuclease SbcCD nuclease subunit
MKIFLISDTHFGIHPIKQDRWMNTQTTWVYNFLIPFLKKYTKEGDILVHLGDVYDNRSSINIKVLNQVVKIFTDLGEILPVHVLIGNHDMWAMSDTEINSIVSIKHIPNINLYTKPTIINCGLKTVLMNPWTHGKSVELDILKKNKADYLFTHSDLIGAKTQIYPTRPVNRNILELKDFKTFKKVYSGHIHINQVIGNFTFIGSPYHLDRNDMGDRKGIYVFNPDNEQEMFIENELSPQYKKLTIKEESDIKRIDYDDCNFNYTDLYVYTNLVIDNKKFRKELDELLTVVNFETITWVDDKINDNILEVDIDVFNPDNTNEENQNFNLNINLLEASIQYSNNIKYSESDEKNTLIKNSINLIIEDAFKKHQLTDTK